MEGVKKISFVSGANVLAQGALLLMTPLLTRLYDTEDFGVYAVFSSVLAIAVILGTLRMELAVPLAREERDAKELISFVLKVAAIVALLVALPVVIDPGLVSSLFGLDSFGWLYALPIAVFAFAMYQLLNFFALRQEQYRILAGGRVLFLVGGGVLQIALAHWLTGPLGLVGGYAIGLIASVSVMAALLRFPIWQALFTSGWRLPVAEQRRYAYFATPAALLNKLSLVLPGVLLAPMFGLVAAGMYGLVLRALSAPVATVGEGFGQVFVGLFSRAIRAGDHAGMRRLYLRFVMFLFVIGVLPFLLLSWLAVPVFSFVFGKEWAKAGEVATLLIPMMLAQFVVYPVSQVFQLLQLQFVQFLWDLVRCIVSVGIFLLAYKWEWSFDKTMVVYSISMALAYLLHAIGGTIVLFRIPVAAQRDKVLSP